MWVGRSMSCTPGRSAVLDFRAPPTEIDEHVKVLVNGKNGARDFECGAGEKILHAGLRSGVALPYECATGTCGTCRARLVSGHAESQWPEAPGRRYFKNEADLLMCQCVAHDDCA